MGIAMAVSCAAADLDVHLLPPLGRLLVVGVQDVRQLPGEARVPRGAVCKRSLAVKTAPPGLQRRLYYAIGVRRKAQSCWIRAGGSRCLWGPEALRRCTQKQGGMG